MKTRKKIYLAGLVLFMALALNTNVYGHCEIPCGIYGDSLRIALLYEHIQTIEKSMNQINELSNAEDKNFHKIVRWVNNKEEHAKEIQEIASQYFMYQRIKIKDLSDPNAYNKYIEQLTLMHKLMVYAMKSKQTTDTKYIDQMRDVVHSFEHAYFGGH
jgi:nickel superoxide dismutase